MKQNNFVTGKVIKNTKAALLNDNKEHFVEKLKLFGLQRDTNTKWGHITCKNDVNMYSILYLTSHKQ